MGKGEITIDEMMCQGCGYCAKFCSRGCIVASGEKLSARGYLVPVFANPENCNACAVCGWMCPHMAIQVYKIEEEESVKS